MTDTPTITRHLVPEEQRLAITAELFGIHFALRLEPVIYGITERMVPAYNGGYWLFYTLVCTDWPGPGFYCAPDDDRVFEVRCNNFWRGTLSADALGIVACLYSYSHLSFNKYVSFAKVCGRNYHLLREYMYGHPEVAAILGAID